MNIFFRLNNISILRSATFSIVLKVVLGVIIFTDKPAFSQHFENYFNNEMLERMEIRLKRKRSLFIIKDRKSDLYVGQLLYFEPDKLIFYRNNGMLEPDLNPEDIIIFTPENIQLIQTKKKMFSILQEFKSNKLYVMGKADQFVFLSKDLDNYQLLSQNQYNKIFENDRNTLDTGYYIANYDRILIESPYYQKIFPNKRFSFQVEAGGSFQFGRKKLLNVIEESTFRL